ncbi:MAG: Lrp/AsnC family transcriptional regulator [Oscillatoriophycideae cyanobacterium NC_groundwater_1537_Pr4_S-0.65um_50_18]|nr:Lrp/AsnC family transcriptional regulator [Oscillatoriophycideae cyanobacterium NC_groundwater_1537_Pr4_S-0.65um_50_18]
MSLDEIDFKVLRHLMAEGRMTWSELAGKLELSTPAAGDRVRRLQERQVITGFAALVDPAAIGCHLTAFIAVTLEHPRHRSAFLQKVVDLPEIQECHHVTGDDDYLLKVRCQTTQALERLISEELKELPGIQKTRTTIALSTVKETPVLPIEPLTQQE